MSVAIAIPRRPRAPFSRIVRDGGGMKCQLCKRKEGKSYETKTHPRFQRALQINAVGPFAICEDCVTVLDEAFAR